VKRVLVIGNGGRESAIISKLKENPDIKIFQWQFNSALNGVFPYRSDVWDINTLTDNLKKDEFDLVIVGPEAPLVMGIADELEKRGILVFGPFQRGALIEGSKSFAKNFMKENNIPTAEYDLIKSYEEGKQILKNRKFPVYIKASGLAAGKGALFVKNLDEGIRILKEIFIEKKFGEQDEAVIEDFLEGEEISMLAFISAGQYFLLPPARDYKKAYDNDKGLNTGGMGSICPVNVPESSYNKWGKIIIGRTVEGFKKAGIDYRGILYAGLMVNNNEPYLLEYNCRFGDPETQSILPLIEGDLFDICCNVAMNKKINFGIKKDLKAITVILAAKGYPENYKKGIEIKIPGMIDNISILPAGLKRKNGKYVSTGGRILGITGIEKDLEKLRKKIYTYIDEISNENTFYRMDIGI
jgi:phosphoribosylamine--glycine ligase